MKVRAVIEVVIILSLTLLLISPVGLSTIGNWERQVTDHFFIEYDVMIASTLILLLIACSNLEFYHLIIE